MYSQIAMPRTFREDLDAHLQHGYIFSTRESFIMGRAIDKDAEHALISDPWHAFAREQQNCWLIYLVAGRVNSLFKYEPYRLPFVAWARNNQTLRVHPFERIKQLCTR